MIKLIALDLDGTTLNSKGKLDPKTREAIENAINKGVEVVIATGRVFSALPEAILDIDGIRYLINSNGAMITDREENEIIYTNFIDENAVETVLETLKKYDFMVEAFTHGKAYMEGEMHRYVAENGSPFNNASYLLSTRNPVDGLLEYIYENKASMENINLNFAVPKDRIMMREVLSNIKNVSITSSFSYNLEICGQSTSKADALKHLCEILGFSPEEVMACGDSENDIEMLRYAGMPVAVGNAIDEVKKAVKYIAPSNDDNGLAEAIKKLIL